MECDVGGDIYCVWGWVTGLTWIPGSPMSAATDSGMHFEKTPKTEEPVSKITGIFWRGVPIETFTKY